MCIRDRGLAKLISEYKEEMAATIKLIFQPAEEGVRGARAMVAKGIVDDVDYMFGGHIGFKATKSDSPVSYTHLDVYKRQRFTWQGTLPEHIYDILYSVVTEDSPRVRCCVHKERAVLKNRINMALGLTVGLNIVEASKIALTEPVNKALPIIDVLPEACDQCPIDKFLVTDACRHCVRCV